VNGPRPASRSLLRHPDFLKLWSAESISQAGTQVSLLAIPFVAISIIGASPFEVALLGTIEFLPFILFTLPAGVWVDRLRRRPILIAGDVVRAVALISIPVAYELNTLTMWQLYVVGFLTGTATVFFDVAYQSYLPALVERDQLVEGNSKLEISRSGAQILGPGAAGILIARLTAPVAIVLDSASFLVSALFLFLIRRPEPAPERHVGEHGEARGSMRRETIEGLRYVLGHRYLRKIAACTSVSNLFSQFVYAILLVYLVRNLGFTAEVVGVLFSIGAVGFLLGALVASRIASWVGVGPAIVASAFLFGPGSLLVAIAPPDLAFPVIATGLFVTGFSGVVYNINQVSLRQAITPERMQGRMNATMRFLVWGTIPIGSLIAGVLATVIGLRETLLLGAIGGFVPFLFVLFSPIRSLEAIPEPVSPAERLSEALDETPAPLGLGPLGRPDED
jgi:MFS family permease